MNRAQRRNAANVKRSPQQSRSTWLDTPAPIEIVGDQDKIKNGDVFTIPGYQRLATSWIKDCEPGKETLMIAVIKQ